MNETEINNLLFHSYDVAYAIGRADSLNDRPRRVLRPEVWSETGEGWHGYTDGYDDAELAKEPQ